MSQQPVALYRLYAEDHALLYVGVSKFFGRRWTQHATSKPWWSEVRHQSIDWYPDRLSAEAAERQAIREEGSAIQHPRCPGTRLGSGRSG